MNSNQSIQRAILAILGTAGAAAAVSPLAVAADANTGDTTAGGGSTSLGLEEVVVTAQRKTENLQDVPITVQATTGAQLQQLNITTINELLKYTPNVTYSGNGPGQGNIFMRGLSYGGAPNQSQSSIAPMPNVALYLDDQSMQFPGRNNDPYMVDLERVEILEGPQGTLFGGGAQAGLIRYITNKPNLNETGGNVHAGYGWTQGGDPNSNADATFNLPLIDGKLALRATIFTDNRGGYIDNLPGTIQTPAQAGPPPGGSGPPARPASPVANNAGMVGNDLNPTSMSGGRFSLAYKFNDNWDALVQENVQNFTANGYFNTEPVAPDGAPLGHYQIEAFAPNLYSDEYKSTSWTLNGNLPALFGDYGDLHMVYSGSYLNREMNQQNDYSNYLTSKHGSYYLCSGQGAGYAYFRSSKPTTCYKPVGSWQDGTANFHTQHEFRVTTSEQNRLRGTAGVFYENFVIKDNMNFNYLPIPQCDAANLAISAAGGPDCVAATGPTAGYYAGDPGLRVNTNTAFGEDIRRGYTQTAFYGSVDFDIIPKVLTITGGTRHYHYDEFEQGSEYYSATSSILNVPNGTQPVRGIGINLRKSESGFKSRANLTWHVTPDILAYYTWSQGFRPGGFNRTHVTLDGTIKQAAEADYTAGDSSTKQFYKPAGYDSDKLLNNEIGLKSEWLDHRVQMNLALYQMDWKNSQLVLFDPVHLGNTTFVVNGPDYRVKGLEVQLVARVTEGLTVQGSSSWNSSEQTNGPCLISDIPGNPNGVGNCITQINSQPYTNPYGVNGARPAFSPALEYNVRLRYDFTQSEYKPFFTVGANYIGSMSNQPASYPDGNSPANYPATTTLLRYTMPAYTTYDASLGIAKDHWNAQLTANNLTNEYASTHTSSGQFIKSEVPLRPRVITLLFGYNF